MNYLLNNAELIPKIFTNRICETNEQHGSTQHKSQKQEHKSKAIILHFWWQIIRQLEVSF